MQKLHLGIEIRDFDLKRLGFSLSVLDETKKRQTSEAYLRMTLAEMNAFIGALRGASETVDVATTETAATGKTVGSSKSSQEPFEPASAEADGALAYSLRR